MRLEKLLVISALGAYKKVWNIKNGGFENKIRDFFKLEMVFLL